MTATRRGRVLAAVAAAGIVAAIAAWEVIAPRPIDDAEVAGWAPDDAAVARGERIFNLGGCAACHAATGAKGDDRLILAGGRRFDTDFGVFVAPNISPDPQAGIGGWSAAQFVSAVLRGVSPDGEHYYPAFPYPSYARARLDEALDLKAYLDTLPPDPTPSAPHELGFPFDIRAGVGLWKLLHMDPAPVARLAPDAPPEARAGRHLVESWGHCGECHTPRVVSGGLDLSRWLGGAPNPDGKGRVPDITPHERALGGWEAEDIAYYIETGFTPDYDSVGGAMVEVVDNLSRLTPADRAAIAAYLKAVPPLAPEK